MSIDYKKLFVKLHDTVLINMVSEEHITMKYNMLTLNLKGSNVKYIRSIISQLFCYNSIFDLHKLLQTNEETSDISIEHFTEILYKLISKGIIECNDTYQIYRTLYKSKEFSTNKTIAIYSFIRPEQLEPLLEILSANNIDDIRIVSFLPPLSSDFQFSTSIKFDCATYEQANKHDINELNKYLSLVDEDVLLTIQSSEHNYKLNNTMNSFVDTNSIPWLNINITPKETQCGPFIINNYLGNYEYFIKVVKKQSVDEKEFYIKENLVEVNEKLKLAYSFIVNEIKAYFLLEEENLTPFTFNKVIIFKDKREFVEMIDILRI